MPVQYYQSIAQLPLNRFVECLVEGNLLQLVKSGTDPDKKQLEQIWGAILLEYNNEMGDEGDKMYWIVRRDLQLMEDKLMLIQAAVQRMRVQYRKDYADDLNLFTESKYAFDDSIPEQYEKELKSCLTKSGSIKINIQLQKLRLVELDKKFATTAKVEPSEKHFRSLLVTLSNYCGFSLPYDQITVFEFCDRAKRYNQYVKSLQEDAQRRKDR